MIKLSLSRTEALEAAIRRLPTHSPERSFLEKELYNITAGMRGEQRLMKKLIEFYSQEKYEIIWNNSLSLGNWPVQIDGLLLTSRVAIVIESKNISGELHFDNDTGEFYRIDSLAGKTVMDNPAIQIEKHVRFMKNWLREHAIILPVDGLLVFTAKQSELKSLPQNIRTCRTHQMIERLFQIINDYPTPTYTKSSLLTIRRLIENKQTPYIQKPLIEQYSIQPYLFNTGVYCTHCRTPTIKKHRRTWLCEECGLEDKKAPHQAVLEHFALFGGPVSNKEIRSFTGINDRHVIKRLLTDLDLSKEGAKKNRNYFLKKNRDT
ncbi:nuclease-related domain-containing protein [Planococcus sp. N028]|uniref:Nuclease-related domain-containing protein n=1 Tax=Planococcus shixiaomingii TaxID=3058393 RepID=A0ABT8MXF2_9BACL|nr:nuclease-related domain-containing protein [Planococcus sp. N028]MDN7240288.1 nuclease-related domain-containing protein [Planococcus sp. N028]